MSDHRFWNILVYGLAFVFLATVFFLSDFGRILFPISAILLVCILIPYFDNHIDDSSHNKIFLYVLLFIMCVKIFFSPEDDLRHKDKQQSEAVGHFLKKANDSLYYTVKLPGKKAQVWGIPVSSSLYHNETKEFVSIREYAVLNSNPYAIKSFDADKEMFESSIVYDIHNYYHEKYVLVDNYYNAQLYPADYFDKYGLKVVYRAKVTSTDQLTSTIYLQYSNEYNQQQTIRLKNRERYRYGDDDDYDSYNANIIYGDVFGNKPYKVGDSVLIYKNIVRSRHEDIAIAAGPDDIDKYDYMDYFGFLFKDTIVSYQSLFEDIPQLKKHFVNDYKLYKYRTGNIGLAYLLKIKRTNGKTSYDYPVFYYFDEDGKIRIFELKMMIDLLKEGSNVLNMKVRDFTGSYAILLDYQDKIALKECSSRNDLLRFKYPVVKGVFNKHEGNNTYWYAKYTDPYQEGLPGFSPDTCYIVKTKNVKPNAMYSKVDVSVTTLDGRKYDITTSIPITSDVKYALLVKRKNGFVSADKQFYTPQYFEKLRDGYGIILEDTILTMREFVEDLKFPYEYLLMENDFHNSIRNKKR